MQKCIRWKQLLGNLNTNNLEISNRAVSWAKCRVLIFLARENWGNWSRIRSPSSSSQLRVPRNIRSQWPLDSNKEAIMNFSPQSRKSWIKNLEIIAKPVDLTLVSPNNLPHKRSRILWAYFEGAKRSYAVSANNSFARVAVTIYTMPKATEIRKSLFATIATRPKFTLAPRELHRAIKILCLWLILPKNKFRNSMRNISVNKMNERIRYNAMYG